MPNPQQTCGNCRFLDDTYEDGNPRCHRYPPQDKEKVWDPKGNMLTYWYFPEVNKDTDWCGEWRPILENGDISAYSEDK